MRPKQQSKRSMNLIRIIEYLKRMTQYNSIINDIIVVNRQLIVSLLDCSEHIVRTQVARCSY